MLAKPPILIVSSDLETQELYLAALRSGRRAAYATSTCDQAITLACERSVGAIVVDIRLANDWDMCVELGQNDCTKGVPVVALSGYVAADRRFRRRSSQAGCAAFVAKPVLPAGLDAVIDRVMAGETGIEVMNSDGV